MMDGQTRWDLRGESSWVTGKLVGRSELEVGLRSLHHNASGWLFIHHERVFEKGDSYGTATKCLVVQSIMLSALALSLFV